MKLNLTRILAILFAIVVLYASCKKNDSKPATAKTSTSEVSQIALSLVQSLSGKLGGANINDGIKAPTTISNSTNGPKLMDITPFCGYAIDSHYNQTTEVGYTRTNIGQFHFVYTCTDGVVNGYNVKDSLYYHEQGFGSGPDSIGILAQSYVVKALDNTYKLVSMDGYVFNSGLDRQLNRYSAVVESHYFESKYTLINVHVKITNGVADMISGKSTFVVIRNDLDSTTPAGGRASGVSGTITFYGNHKAKIVLNYNPPQTYLVDLTTGVVTPA